MFFRQDKEITAIEIAAQAVNQLRTDNSRMRRVSMKKKLDYYYGKQLNYLNDLLNNQFEKPDRLKLQKEFYNVTEMIINEIAVLYSETPIRSLIDENAETVESPLFDEIVEWGKLDATMATVNKLTKLCKTVLVRPVWRDDYLQFDIYTPNMFDVIQDPANPTKALGIVYANQVDFQQSKKLNNDDKTIYQDAFNLPNTIFYVWTKEKHFAFTYQLQSLKPIIKILANENNINNENPYKMLPFAVIYDGMPIDNFFVEGGDDLINANEIINIKLVEKNHLTKMQSFSIPVRKGADNTKDVIIFDPSLIVDIPADSDVAKGSDFKFVTPDAKLTDVENDIESKLKRIAVKYKLNPDLFVASGNRSSAESLQLQNYFLGKIIKADKPLYADYERELFEIMVVVYNYHSTGEKLPENCNLFIDYKDIEVPMTIEQEDSHNTLMYTNKLMSRADWLMKENPDIRSKKQAQNKLEEIDEEEKEVQDARVQAGIMASNKDEVIPHIEEKIDEKKVNESQ